MLAAGAIAAIAALSLAFPTGGIEPFVFSALLPVPLLAAAALILLPAEEANDSLGDRRLRAGLRRGVRDPESGRRQHDSPRRPGGRSRPRPRADRSPAGGPGAPRRAAPLLAMDRPRPRPLGGVRGPFRQGVLLRAPARRSFERRDPWRSRSDRDPADQESLGGRPTSRRAFRSPGVGFASSSPTTSTCSRTATCTPRTTEAGSYDRGVTYVAVSDAEPDYLCRGRGGPDRASGLPYLSPAGRTRIGICIAVRGTPGLVSTPRDLLGPWGMAPRLTELGPAELHALGSRPGTSPRPPPLHAVLDRHLGERLRRARRRLDAASR